ncbi:MAG TPA: flagellar motor protein MotB [bacterium]|nr:flagellar motor protein MotB [bacterium]
MPKRRKGGHEAGLELESGGMMRWLLTYADMITLLLALFVVLFALSTINKATVLKVVLDQFKAVFGPIQGNITVLPAQSANPGVHFKIIPAEPEEGGPGGPKKPSAPPAKSGDMNKVESQLRSLLEPQLGAKKVLIRKEARGLVISLMTDKVLFDLGDYHLKKEMRDILDPVSKVLNTIPENQIVVEGHTDDLAMGGKIADNWQLSALRATSVVEYLVTARGVDPGRLSAAGYGEYKPLVPNVSEANRRLNRRVDIVIMKLD